MNAKCYICNKESSDWRRNFAEIKSQHTQTSISHLIRQFLGDFQSMRNIDNESNCICGECVQKIDDYDWTCHRAIEQEEKLRDLLWSTEAKLIEIKEVSKVITASPDESDSEFYELIEIESETETEPKLEIQITKPNPDSPVEKVPNSVKKEKPFKLKGAQVCDPSLAGNEMFIRQGERLLTFRLVNPPTLSITVANDPANNTPLNLKCKFCHFRSDDKTSYKEHMELHDKKSSPLVCIVCDKSFEKARTLQIHNYRHYVRKYFIL